VPRAPEAVNFILFVTSVSICTGGKQKLLESSRCLLLARTYHISKTALLPHEASSSLAVDNA
jgi:hypothetical protein